MSLEEVVEFERNPHFEAAVRLRKIDDRAKNPTAVTPGFLHFVRHVAAALAARSAV